jgi:DHA1 family bicyclomycin/chloramphenicol resistance-like MFS transporter
MSDRPIVSGNAIIFTLAAIAALGSMAIHMLVPALPLLAHDLAIGEAQAQLAVSVYLAGLGGGQFVMGPAADRLGRRPVMMAGLVCYIVGAAAAALAPNLPVLLIARLLQALGGAAGVVTARVMVSDVFGAKEAAAKQATLMAVVLISPALAPLIGGALADTTGWRTIMGLLCMAGLLSVMMMARLLPETHQPAAASGNALKNIAVGYGRLLRNRRFLFTVGVLATASSGLYMFLGASSFLLIHRFGLTSAETGAGLLTVAVASVLGTRFVVLAQKCGDALSIGAAISATGAVGALICALLDLNSAVTFVAPMTLLGVGAGLMGPTAITEIAFVETGLAATATSLAGAIQMLASGLAIATLGLFAPIDPLILSIALVCATASTLTCSVLRH